MIASRPERTHVVAVLLKNESFRRKAALIVTFIAGQGCAQLLTVACGFLVLRWLDIPSYAQYGLTFSFQSSATFLSDLGFATTIVALVGRRIHDRSVIGAYIRSGRHLRLTMVKWGSPVFAAAFFLLTKRFHWPLWQQIVLLASVGVSLWFSGLQAYYASALLVQRRLSLYYRLQSASAGFRLALYVGLHLAGLLNACTAVWTNALGIVIAGLLFRRVSRSLIEEPARPRPEITRQMIHYLMPNIPSTIFYALQGQIAVFLIAALGQSRSTAQVSALSRLAQLFMFLAAFNGTVLEPWFARGSEHQTLRRYSLAAAGVVVLSLVLYSLAAVFPHVFLWVLGSRYMDLERELRWTVLTGCIAYFGGVTWTAISGRRYIYWMTALMHIGFVLAAQVSFVVLVGVKTPLQAVQFGTASATALLLAEWINLAYGFKRGPRIQIAPDPAETCAAGDLK